jgi:hypothetical protein
LLTGGYGKNIEAIGSAFSSVHQVGAVVEVEVVIKVSVSLFTVIPRVLMHVQANPADMIAMALKVVEVVVGTSKAVAPVVDTVAAVTVAVGITTANTKEGEVTAEEEAKATKAMAANPATDFSTRSSPFTS